MSQSDGRNEDKQHSPQLVVHENGDLVGSSKAAGCTYHPKTTEFQRQPSGGAQSVGCITKHPELPLDVSQEEVMHAAQYVRMSTEHQQYSIDNQKAVIREYASHHGFQIVRTYSDQAKSGIDLAHRPALRQLLRDVSDADPGFKTILVYDVSRWGRFQDTDESAFHEFWCKQFGIRVHYCAEQFTNDNTIGSSLLKTLKRVMAGEYLRELSARVHAGQCRLARRGFKLGGSAGYGLRRLLVDGEGNPRMILVRGERKSIATDRVTYVPGPAREIRVVRKIYSLFLDSDMTCSAIATELNRRSIPRDIPKPWNVAVVHRILSHPKYSGAVVFNQKSGRLRSRTRGNPRDEWVIKPDSFPPIIAKERFEQAQKKLLRRVFLRTDEELLAELKTFADAHPHLTNKMLAEDREMATALTYQKRFGSIRRALAQANWNPPSSFSEIDNRAWLKMLLHDEFSSELAAAGALCRKYRGRFRSPMGELVVLDVARCYRGTDGESRWEIRLPLDGGPRLVGIALRLAEDNRTPKDYVFFPCLPEIRQKFRFSDERARRLGVITDRLSGAVGQMLSSWETSAAQEAPSDRPRA
jgi:DNA invertase Pin-like site-specific DNA recombinase